MKPTLILALCLMIAPGAAAQKKKPVVKKPAAAPVKPAPQPTGIFGRTAALPALGIQLTLLSAQLTMEPVNIGDHRMAPKADQKLLLVRFKVQNARSGDLPMPLTGSMVQAVAQDDATYVACETLGYESKTVYVGAETRKSATELILKRTQNAPVCLAVIPVPAEGEVPKLIFQTGAGGNILRFDLRGQVKPLAESERDPADPKGFLPRKEYVWKTGERARTWGADFTLEKMETSSDPMLLEFVQTDTEKNGVLVATMSLQINIPYEKYLFNSDNTFEVKAFDTDGNTYEATLMAASRIASVDVVKHGKGSQLRVRYAIPFPRDAKLDRLVIRNQFWTGESENPTAQQIQPSRPYIFPGDMLFPGGLSFTAQ
jgi:hypothetical protein